MADMRERWEKLTPKQKQMALWAGGILILFFVSQVFMTPPKPIQPPNKKAVDKAVFTDANARQMGLDAMAGRVHTLEDSNRRMSEQLGQLQAQLVAKDEAEQKRGLDAEKIKQEIRQELQEQKPATTAAPTGVNPFENPLESNRELNQPYTFTQEHPAGGSSGAAAPAALPPGSASARTPPQIRDVGPAAGEQQGSVEGRAGPAGIVKVADEKLTVGKDYVPAGAMIHTVLLTGIDAPTGKKLADTPYPVLARVQMDTILPNYFRADMQDCFIIANGNGDLSSERAYLRAVTLTCIRSDGGVVELSLAAFVVGEDGKLGLRGRVVSKQGQVIARALLAGVASGFSTAFQKAAIPVLATTGSSAVQYQSQFTGEGLQNAGVTGVGKALDRVAQFYTDMAENLFPVIEVDAERHADFILTKGLALDHLRGLASDTPLEAGETFSSTNTAQAIEPPIAAGEVEAARRAQQINVSLPRDASASR